MRSLGHLLALRGVQIIALFCATMVNVVTGNAATVNRVPIAGPGDRIAERLPAENEFPTAGQSPSLVLQ
jgi:hypothetical protein